MISYRLIKYAGSAQRKVFFRLKLKRGLRSFRLIRVMSEHKEKYEITYCAKFGIGIWEKETHRRAYSIGARKLSSIIQ
jgi:hypothetical protein